MGELPHGYPFRFVDIVLREKDPAFTSGTVSARVTANARAAMGESWGSPLLLAEALAQSALLLEGGDSEIGRGGFLAGIDDFSAVRPPRAGESLRVEVRLAGRFGAIVRFEGEVFSEGEKIARGAIIVRRGEDPFGSPV